MALAGKAQDGGKFIQKAALDPWHEAAIRHFAKVKDEDTLGQLGKKEVKRGDKPAEQVRLVVRVTGADGYTAVIALGEMAPQFAGHPIQIADHMNAAPIPDHGLRLVVPGDKRGGRSVRDVVRIEIE